LLDLRVGNQVVWSRRFDRDVHDLLTMQDDIAAEVVAQIDPEILLIGAPRVTQRPPLDATGYDMVLRAIPLIGRLDRVQFMQAGGLLADAVAQEPDYAPAHAWFAYWQMFLVGQRWTENPKAAMLEASKLAERAITLDPHDGRALSIAGHVRSFINRRLREALALHERALNLNPNLAMAWALSGVAYAYLGELDEAERRFARYKKLSPFDPHAFFYDTIRILILLLQRRHEDAVEAGRDVSQMNPSFSAAYKPYLAALGHLHATAEIETVRERLMALEPGFTVAAFMAESSIERPEDRAHYAEGLLLAGVPAE
ncbi:MAG: hypothetical protein H7251_08080, partial [Acetobacteraceae bacterium]|nr:hypothetical protein [Acetobacteraceae bacterium]